MCLALLILLMGPRLGIVFWWLLQPGRWESAFDSAVWPVLGFVFLPWTTLMFVVVAPFGNVSGADWLLIALGLLLDLGSSAGSGYRGRGRVPNYAQ